MSDPAANEPQDRTVLLYHQALDSPPFLASLEIEELGDALLVQFASSASMPEGWLGGPMSGIPILLDADHLAELIKEIADAVAQGRFQGNASTLSKSIEIVWRVESISETQWEQLGERAGSLNYPPDFLVHWTALPVRPESADCWEHNDVPRILQRFNLPRDLNHLPEGPLVVEPGASRARIRLSQADLSAEKLIELAAVAFEAQARDHGAHNHLQIVHAWATASGMETAYYETVADSLAFATELADRVLPAASHTAPNDDRRECLIETLVAFSVGWRFVEIIERPCFVKLIGPVESVFAPTTLQSIDSEKTLERLFRRLILQHQDEVIGFMPADTHSDADTAGVAAARRAMQVELAQIGYSTTLSNEMSFRVLEAVVFDHDRADQIERALLDLVVGSLPSLRDVRAQLRPVGVSERTWMWLEFAAEGIEWR